MAILNWDGLSHYDFKMKAKITEWLNSRAEKVHTHTKSEVGLDQVDNTSDADKPISTAQKKKFAEIDTAIAGKSPTGHKHTKSDITDFPTLGTASSKDVAATGNASATQVVMGNDSRLTDARKASDVQAWAKAENKPSYTKLEVGLGNVDNTADSTKSVKYATSAGSAGWATKATAIVDYAQTSRNIQIGYSGDGISGDNIKFIAGYTEGNGSDVDAKIKDVSKDALKSWLGLGSLAYSSATIPTIPTSLPANGGNSTTVNGHTVNADVPSGAKFTDTHTDPVLTKTASTTVGAMWYE